MTPKLEELLELIIIETQKKGPPALSRIKEISKDQDVWQDVRYLRDGGYVRQLGKHGPWCPIRTTDGSHLVLKLIELPHGIEPGDAAEHAGLAAALIRGAMESKTR